MFPCLACYISILFEWGGVRPMDRSVCVIGTSPYYWWGRGAPISPLPCWKRVERHIFILEPYLCAPVSGCDGMHQMGTEHTVCHQVLRPIHPTPRIAQHTEITPQSLLVAQDNTVQLLTTPRTARSTGRYRYQHPPPPAVTATDSQAAAEVSGQ